jgi:hypothetical protein
MLKEVKIMPLESTIVSNILKYLNYEVDSCIAEKVHGNTFQVGRPDINGCWKGQCFKIEVKTPDHGNKPTKLQELNLEKWAKNGALCFIAYSLNDVKCVINNEENFYYESFKGKLFPITITEEDISKIKNNSDKCKTLIKLLKGFIKYKEMEDK